MNTTKPVLVDIPCPNCGNVESTIWGHINIHTARKCLACSKIYNKE